MNKKIAELNLMNGIYSVKSKSIFNIICESSEGRIGGFILL